LKFADFAVWSEARFSGMVKTALLRVMAGLLTPTAGTVMLQQQAMKNLKNRQRAAKVGVLFQEAENQLFHSTVADEIAFGLKLQKCPMGVPRSVPVPVISPGRKSG
ncbi:ATP-binding cassette domain-containing protein, partial [Escherichia sp. TWPC-MK]